MNRSERRSALLNPAGQVGDEIPIRKPHEFVRPGFGYMNPVEPIKNAAGETVTQADYDKLVRLCRTHGLLV